MRNFKLFISPVIILALIFFCPGITSSEVMMTTAVKSSVEGFTPIAANSPIDFIVCESHSIIELTVTIDQIERNNDNGCTVWRIPNEGLPSESSMLGLPIITRWVRVPDGGKLALEYTIESQERVKGDAPRIGQTFPEVESVVMERPMVMRGVRIVPLMIHPVTWDEVAGEFVVSYGFNITIKGVGGQGINEVETLNRTPSRDFDRLLDGLLVNPPRRDDPEFYLPGGYLLIANEDPPEAVDEFMEWKYRAGHPIDLLTFNPDETDTDELRDMILEVYQEFSFEFLVLFGSEDADPPLQIPYHDEGQDPFYDIYFGQLEGDDMLPDVAVGTFNCTTEENLTCAVRRAISYQYEPYFEDTDWYTRAGVGVGACSVPDDLSPSYTGKWINEVLSRRGFDDISTSFFSDNEEDDPTPMVNDLYNEGTNFILVRAHQHNFDAVEVEESEVYPFQFLCSSSTISNNGGGSFNRTFRQGTPDIMKGPSAGFGHYSSPRTNIANALAGGLIESLFFLHIDTYGWARNYTVANLARVMPADGVDNMPYYYSHWRYYGDPGQWCWRGVPEEIEVEHNETIDPDATDIRIIVTDDEDDPIEGALVCLTQDDGIQLVTFTQETGWAFFTWEQGDLNEEPLSIMVTGDDIYPYQGEVQVEDAEIFVSLTGFEIEDEEEGDGDGIPNAGETVDLYLILENTSDNPTDMLGLTIHSFSPWARVEGEVIIIDVLEPGQSRRIFRPFIVHIANGCPDGESVQIRIGIGGITTSGLILDIESPALVFEDIELEDPLNPGSETELAIFVSNRGHKDTGELFARLESLTPFVTVISASADFPEIEVDGCVENDDDLLSIRSAETTIPGSLAEFRLILEGDPSVQDTIYFSLPVDEASRGDPLGPDSYGYIALDNTDDDVEWAESPEYEWLSISPWDGDVEGELLDLPTNGEGDMSVLVELPFAFRYYGEDFNEITVCSNGWIAMGDQTELVNQQNWVMPGFDGAFGMIAVFWDRLECQTGFDGVFNYYDEQNGKFYIEWHTGITDDNEWAPNVFEIVLFDPERYETPTGDSPILFQYNTVNNNQGQWEANYHCTVGISSPEGLDGLTYTYWDNYPTECARLHEGRAILWTTVVYDIDAGSIRGRVTRYIDEAVVAGATVSTSHGFETRTNADGEYQLLNIDVGTFDITVTAESYGSVTLEDVELEDDGEIELDDIVLPHGWLVVDPDTIFINDSLFQGRSYDMVLIVSNEGNSDLEIDEITSNSEYIWINPNDLLLESEESEVLTVTVDFDDLEPGRYEYELSMINSSPVSPFIVPIIVDILDSVWESDLTVPDDFILSNLYPNPFNSATTVEFGVPRASDVQVHLFDITGRKVATLTQGNYTAGWHRSVIDASNLATGLYFIEMEADDFSAIRRVLLIR
ncbi:MAG: carboxypeptidase regulatory-like domain-containing protein [Candidatus Hatepunaea meridiana]|nr:carboxypeptidase regulatory-like domain-containing protein [Candidatus Hatepunaea meridiana]